MYGGVIMNDLEQVEGIGPKTKELLEKLQIYTIEDLLEHYPYRYEVLKRSNLQELKDGDKIIIDGIIEGQPTIIYLSPKLKKIILRINTGNNILNIIIYNKVYLMDSLKSSRGITVIGKYDKIKNAIIASDVRQERLPIIPKIESIYYTTSGLSRKSISKYISTILLSGYKPIEYLPSYLLEKHNLLSKYESLSEIHNPTEIMLLKRARQRLKYEELFLYLLKINYLKDKNNSSLGAITREIAYDKINKLISSLPYELTIDQKNSLDEILNDMASDNRMNRLLQGDVGSGKTIVALLASYANYLSKYQTAIMAPTEILATQHYNEVKKLFKDTKMHIELLTSSTTKKEKERIYNELSNGTVDLIIGTQSLIQKDVTYHNLGLIITDEQHRFGVNQRTAFKNKGQKPDVLSMSATPIPRTYALTIYGDLDLSQIKTKPNIRKEIKTKVVYEQNIKEVLMAMYEELKLNHQIFVVSPLIMQNDELDLNSVIKLKEKLDIAFNKKVRIEILHGKLKQKEKDELMKEFQCGKIKILISTTVIEVGIDVPNATMMVIFNAERFGLATLHQLRGRVGRSNLQSYCYLVTNTKNNERLKVMEESSDGFYISEMDFKQRGQGDLFGIKQSGDMSFKIANLNRDYNILMQTNKDSNEFLTSNNYKENELYTNIVKDIANLD